MKNEVILACDVGGTTCKLGIFDSALNIIEKWVIETDITDTSGRVILQQIVESLNAKLKALAISEEDVLGLGLGIPGPINFEEGSIHGAVNLNWPYKVYVKSILEEFVDYPIVVDNDANVAALGEKFKGAGKGSQDVVAITLGTGLGGGIISNDKIVHGHNGSGAELGHIRVDFDQRFNCNCGKSGCVETVASATGVTNLVYFYYPKLTFKSSILELIKNKTVTAKDVFDAAKAGDQFCIFITERVAHYIAYLASMVSVTTNPEYIILGGGMSNAGDILIENIKTEYYHFTFTPAQENTKIVKAELGNDAGIVGAAGLIKTYIEEKE